MKNLFFATALLFSCYAHAAVSANENQEVDQLVSEHKRLGRLCFEGKNQACEQSRQVIRRLEQAGMCHPRIDGPEPGHYRISNEWTPCTPEEISERKSKEAAEAQERARSQKIIDAQTVCRMKGEIFALNASSRDQGMPPENAYAISAQYINPHWPELTKDFVKNSVNLVYFDPRFANAGGAPLSRQIAELCITDGKPRYSPLK